MKKTYQFKLTLMPAEKQNGIITITDNVQPAETHLFEASSKNELQISVSRHAEALALPCIAVVEHAGEGYPPIWLKHFKDQNDCHFNV